jgi:hypothetical protein
MARGRREHPTSASARRPVHNLAADPWRTPEKLLAGHLFKATEERATSPAALQHRSLMAQRDRFRHQCVRFRSSLPATETAPLACFAIKTGYRVAIETTNEFVRIDFSETTTSLPQAGSSSQPQELPTRPVFAGRRLLILRRCGQSHPHLAGFVVFVAGRGVQQKSLAELDGEVALDAAPATD